MFLRNRSKRFILFSKKQTGAALAVNRILNRTIHGLPLLIGNHYMITFSKNWYGKVEFTNCEEILKDYRIKYKILGFKD